MNRSEIEKFEKTTAQVLGLWEELSSVAKKKPDAPLSLFKLKLVNNLVEQLNNILGKRYKPFSDFENFDLDEVPTISDATTILGQYLECAETMRSDNIKFHNGVWRWAVDDDLDDLLRIRTAPPKKLVRK